MTISLGRSSSEKSEEKKKNLKRLAMAATFAIPYLSGARGVSAGVTAALKGARRFLPKGAQKLAGMAEGFFPKEVTGTAATKGAQAKGIEKAAQIFKDKGMIRPHSANVRAIEATDDGVYVLFSGGGTYKYDKSMEPDIFASLGKPFTAKTTGKNAFKAWYRGNPSIGGSFHELVAKDRIPGTYVKTFTAPRNIMRAKLTDAIVRSGWLVGKKMKK